MGRWAKAKVHINSPANSLPRVRELPCGLLLLTRRKSHRIAAYAVVWLALRHYFPPDTWPGLPRGDAEKPAGESGRGGLSMCGSIGAGAGRVCKC